MFGRFANKGLVKVRIFNRGLNITFTTKIHTKSGKPTKSDTSTVFQCTKPFRITVGGNMYVVDRESKSKSGMVTVTEKSVPVKLHTDELHTNAERKSSTNDLFSSSYQPDVKFSGESTTKSTSYLTVTKSTSDLTATYPLTNIQPTKPKPLVPIPPATSNDSAICTNPSDPHFHWLP